MFVPVDLPLLKQGRLETVPRIGPDSFWVSRRENSPSQGVRFHSLYRQPVPELSDPHRLSWWSDGPSCVCACYIFSCQWGTTARSLAPFLAASVQLFVLIDTFPAEPSLLRAEQPWLSQPLFRGGVLWSSLWLITGVSSVCQCASCTEDYPLKHCAVPNH